MSVLARSSSDHLLGSQHHQQLSRSAVMSSEGREESHVRVGRFLVAEQNQPSIGGQGTLWTSVKGRGLVLQPGAGESRRSAAASPYSTRGWMEPEQDSGYLTMGGSRQVPLSMLRPDQLTLTSQSIQPYQPNLPTHQNTVERQQGHREWRGSLMDQIRQRPPEQRVVRKEGLTNVSFKNISKKRRHYFSDLYTTLLDSSWTYCIIMLTISFYGSWLLFGALYYLILHLHGDLVAEPGHMPCILEVRDFASCFLFSLETQHTIGYGTRQTTTQCSDAIIVMSLQAVLGCLIQAFMVGLVFSKLTQPRHRTKTIIFSNTAVINLRNGKLCLVIRIGDVRQDNFILGTQISVKLMRNSTTEEGERFQEMCDLKVTPDTSQEASTFFVWPLDIVHEIDSCSPLYDMTAASLMSQRFELVVVMEGTSETNNMTFQARTSYLPTEVQWGHRFEQMLIYRRDHNKFQVNFAAFHSTYEVATPLCSARNLAQCREQEHNQDLSPGLETSSTLLTATHQDSIQGEFLLRSVSRSASQHNVRKPSTNSDSPISPLFLPDQKVAWTIGEEKRREDEK